jgi:hypothetical protein
MLNGVSYFLIKFFFFILYPNKLKIIPPVPYYKEKKNPYLDKKWYFKWSLLLFLISVNYHFLSSKENQTLFVIKEIFLMTFDK